MTPRAKRILLWSALGTAGTLLAAAAVLYRLLMPGAQFLSRVDSNASAGPALREWTADAGGVPVRVYQPDGGHDRVFVLVHGLHWDGYNEARLVPFARQLASMGHAVVTPDIEEFKTYNIDPRAIDAIEAACLWTLDRSGLVRDGRVGLMGICFAGGLGLSAACRPSLRDRLSCVFAFGAHGDLDTTIEYLVSGRSPAPHIYGQAVLLRWHADKLVDDPESLRDALLHYLRGEETLALEMAARQGPRAEELVRLCVDRKTIELGALLAPHARAVRSPDALSPVRLPNPPPCPVFVLHGTVDNVVPPSESRRLAAWAPRSRLLVSDLVVHVNLDPDRPRSCGDQWDLARFWTEFFRS